MASNRAIRKVINRWARFVVKRMGDCKADYDPESS
jgi:hypothetical protein